MAVAALSLFDDGDTAAILPAVELIGSLADGAPAAADAAAERALACLECTALGAVLRAMDVQPSNARLHGPCCRALAALSAPSPAVEARCARLVADGAPARLAASLDAHARATPDLARWAVLAHRHLTSTNDAIAPLARKQAALDAGAARALCAAMLLHARDVPLQLDGSAALRQFSRRAATHWR